MSHVSCRRPDYLRALLIEAPSSPAAHNVLKLYWAVDFMLFEVADYAKIYALGYAFFESALCHLCRGKFKGSDTFGPVFLHHPTYRPAYKGNLRTDLHTFSPSLDLSMVVR